ncbi:MAG: NlpC/P60 family protein [Longibaculum sp.]
MKKKPWIIFFLLTCLIFAFSFHYQSVHATDFNGQEDKYIKLCSSSKLSKSQQKTCKEFNTYLKNKNKKLSQQATDAKKDAVESQNTIEEIADKITNVENKISVAQKEIKYVQKSIDNLNQQIRDKNEKLADRLYSMQGVMNSNIYVSYIFGAEDFSDFMGRIINFNEIMEYDKELVHQLNESLNEVKQQQETLNTLKSSLEKDKVAQTELKKKFQAKLLEQNKTITANSNEISKNQESMEAIQDNLAALQKAADESKVSNVTHATPNKKPSQTTQNNSSKPNQNTSKPDTNQSSNNSQTQDNTPQDNNQSTPSENLSSNEELGLKIANLALTRQGYMYVWGGAHSWSSIKNPNWTQFDCSGLVNWAHYQAGVDLGRIHYTGSMINAGKGISKSQLQAGDIILFSSNGSSSGVHHVGIYIGDNKMVHAPTTGKPVQVANLNTSYWQREWYSCRRLY